MAARRRGARLPDNANPVSVTGEAACQLADELGIPVEVYSLRGGRSVSTGEARALMARCPETAAMVWVITAYELT